jgi:hypothetical protein
MAQPNAGTMLRTSLVAGGDHAVAAQCLRVADELAAASRQGL